MDLEPQGKIHVIINLRWTDENDTQSGSGGSGCQKSDREFKERAGFNRRRGAMRRRVHQVEINMIYDGFIRCFK